MAHAGGRGCPTRLGSGTAYRSNESEDAQHRAGLLTLGHRLCRAPRIAANVCKCRPGAVLAVAHRDFFDARLCCQGPDGNTLIRDRLLATDSKPFQALPVDTKGFPMNRSIWIAALLVPLSLAACDRPTIVNAPPTLVPVPGPVVAVPGPVVAVPGPAVAVPGPAGPQGATGMQGNDGNTGATGSQGMDGSKGNKGDTGRSGDGTTVVVVRPAASAPTN